MRLVRRGISTPVLAASILAVVLVGSGAAAKDDTTLVSLAKVVPGGKADASTFSVSVSDDGRYVAFSTQASNLDANDTNNDDDVYVRDTVSGTTTLVTPGDGPNDAAGAEPAISNDGQTVAFIAYDDIDPDDSNNENDIYVADMSTNPPTLSLASRPTGSGAGAPSAPEGATSAAAISGDGNVVGFVSADNTLDAANDADTVAGSSRDVFIRELDSETTELVSRGATDGNDSSWNPALDADGSHVSFDTQATNLDAADTDADRDVFVRDRTGGTLTLVSRADGATGAKANDTAIGSSLSGDGEVVSFMSEATNLHPDDGDATYDVYVREIDSNETELVSRASGASGAKANKISQGASISADGTEIAFISSADNLDPAQTSLGPPNHAYIRYLDTDITKLQSRADGGSGLVANDGVSSVVISSNGLALGFTSKSTNLDPGDPDTLTDAYVRNTGSGDTVLASQAPVGIPVNANGDSREPSVSADGRYIAFRSAATNLDPAATNNRSDIFVLDTDTSEIELASRATGAAGSEGNESSGRASISADGRFVAFESDADNLTTDGDGDQDIFVRDLDNDTTTLVSLNSSGQNIAGFIDEPSISADGERVAFSTDTSYHPDDGNVHSDIYVRDLTGSQTLIASRPDGANNLTGAEASYAPDISDDGTSVAFESDADNLTGPSTFQQIVVRDLDANTTRPASRASGAAGAIGSSDSYRPTISADGSRVAFHTDSNNLHPDDPTTNGSIFVRDLDDSQTILVSRATDETPADASASNPAISGDGTYVAFRSAANNLDPASSDTRPDIYLRDLLAGDTKLVSRADGPAGAEGDDTDDNPSLSKHGRFVAYDSISTNLDPADDDGQRDVYLREALAPDADPPGTSITSGPAEGSINPQDSFTFGFSVDEPFSTSECRIDAATFTSCSTGFQSGQLSQGTHTFEVRSTDRFGNLESPAAARTFTVDTTPPDTTIDSGPSGAIATDEATFTFSGTPAGDTAKIQCKIDSQAFADCTSPKTFTGLGDGPHTATFRAEDAVGNQDPSPATRTFTVDTTPPDTTIDSGPSGTGSNSNPTATFRSTEAEATLECSIDGAAFSACSSPLSLGPLPDGEHSFRARSIDRAGNVDGSPAERSFNVDTIISGRQIKAKSPQKGQKKKVKIKVTAKTGEKATVKITGKVTKGGGKLKQVKVQAADGKKATLFAKLKKKSGNDKVARKLKRGKKVKAKLTVTVTDDAGNVKTTKKTVKLK